jgi:hypothetical protein
MAFQVIDRSDPRFPPNKEIGADYLARQQMMHARRIDEKEEFVKETMTISTGPKNTQAEVVVRFPRSARIIEHKDDLDNVIKRERIWTNGRFIFAVYSDNESWHKAARDEWEAGARNAIEKFAAVHNVSITVGPRPEDSNRYNIMAECREAIQ